MLQVGEFNGSINEALTLRKVVDRFGQKRIVVFSDDPDPKVASNETYAVRDILKNTYKAAWDATEKHWYWNDRFKSVDEILKLAKAAVADGNKKLNVDNNPDTEKIEKYDDIEDLIKQKEFLENLKGAAEVVNKSGKITKELIDNYINQLAEDLSDQKLLDDIASFNKAAAAYILDTGRYSYSFYNTFLIWLQATKGAREFGSTSYWLGRGYEPMENAKGILILKPRLSGSLAGTVATIIKNYPKSPAEYAAESGFKITDVKNPIPKEKYQAFWVWAKKKGYVKFYNTSSFDEVRIFDNKNVQPISGRDQVDPPESPKWYNDDETEDEKSGVMIRALEMFCKENGIEVKREKDLGGARGTSYGGHIKLLTNSAGAGLLSTFVHEIAHELLHQPNNKGLFGGKLYIGRGFTSEEKELHAESIAYSVMKSYDFPIQHSINYLAMWKSDKDKVRKYQKLIRDTSFFIVQQIEKYAPMVNGDSESLSESLNVFKTIINDFKMSIE